MLTGAWRAGGVSVRAGQGTYGRVRLAESPAVKEKYSASSPSGLYHPGYFAIKILKKSEIIRLKQGEHVKSERDLLLNKVSHPFIVTAHGTYKDERNLFMILEYVPGGEVLAQCRAATSNLDNDTSKCARKHIPGPNRAPRPPPP